MVLFLGKTIFIIIDKWKNRNNNTITHIPQHFFIEPLEILTYLKQSYKMR